MNNEINQYLQAGKKNLIVIYILYLGGVAAPLLPIIGAVLAYVNKDVNDRLLASHYTLLFRTFWMVLAGTLLSVVTAIIFIGPIIYGLVVIWAVFRLVIGLKYLTNDLEHPNPLSLWIK
jgi:uncharacterized membrane protein